MLELAISFSSMPVEQWVSDIMISLLVSFTMNLVQDIWRKRKEGPHVYQKQCQLTLRCFIASIWSRGCLLWTFPVSISFRSASLAPKLINSCFKRDTDVSCNLLWNTYLECLSWYKNKLVSIQSILQSLHQSFDDGWWSLTTSCETVDILIKKWFMLTRCKHYQ